MRDLDLLRQILGKKKVSWLGYSAGTWMGAYYATYFPKTLDKIVLDSNTEFTESWQKVFDNLPAGSELRFRVDFLPWVAKYDNVFHLGKTAEEVRQSYETTRARLVEQPATSAGRHRRHGGRAGRPDLQRACTARTPSRARPSWSR